MRAFRNSDKQNISGLKLFPGSDPCDCRQKLPPVIIGEGDIDDQVRYAVRCVCGEDRVIVDIECFPRFRRCFPDGTKHFIITSRSSPCECSPPCVWTDSVYWYADRSVVVRMSEIHTTLLSNVIRQLRSDYRYKFSSSYLE